MWVTIGASRVKPILKLTKGCFVMLCLTSIIYCFFFRFCYCWYNFGDWNIG